MEMRAKIVHQTHSQVLHLPPHAHDITSRVIHQTHALHHHLADRTVVINTDAPDVTVTGGGDVVIPAPVPVGPVVIQGQTSHIAINIDDLPLYDFIDDLDPDHFYFAWQDVHGQWLVEQQDRVTSDRLFAYGSDNPTIDYDTAIDDRMSLSFV